MNTTDVPPYILPIDHQGTVAMGVVILVLLIVGGVLNAFTIYVITRLKERNLFCSFLLSLCISNLLSAIISPLFWYRRTIGFDVWRLSDFLCKFYWGADMATSCVTALHILTFTMLRFTAISYPHLFNKVTTRRAQMCILGIWVIALATVFAPMTYFTSAHVRNRTSNDEDAKWASCSDSPEVHKVFGRYVMITLGFLVYIPMMLIAIFSSLVAWRVKRRFAISRKLSNCQGKTSSKKKRKERQALYQLLLVVTSFFIGYVPTGIYGIWTQSHERFDKKYAAMDYWGLIISYLCVRFSECLDPVFYTMGSSQIKRESKRVLDEALPCLGRKFYVPGDETSSKSNDASTGQTKVYNNRENVV